MPSFGLVINEDLPAKEIAIITTLQDTFDISFDFCLMKITGAFQSVLRFESKSAPADLSRLPAFFIDPDGKLLVWYQNDAGKYYFYTSVLILEKWYKYTLHHKLINGVYKYQFFVDDVLADEGDIAGATKVDNVRVTIGDFYYKPVDGRFDNLRVANPIDNAASGQYEVHMSKANGDTTIY